MSNQYKALHERFALDTEEFIGDFLGIVISDQSGDELLCNCPQHDSESEMSMHVNVKNRVFNCYGCGVSGDICNLVEFVRFGTCRDQKNCYIAVKEFCEQNCIPFDEKTNDTPAEYLALEMLSRLAHENLLNKQNDVVAGLKKKYGFDEETLKKYQIGYIDDEVVGTAVKSDQEMGEHLNTMGIATLDGKSTYEGWITIPHIDRYGQYRYMVFRNRQGICEGISARYGNSNEVKYLNLKANKEKGIRKDFPFGELYNVRSEDDSLIIVEGQFDAISLQTSGFNALSVGTKSVPDNIVNDLTRAIKPYETVYICFDNDGNQETDEAQKKVANKLFSSLPEKDIRLVRLPESEESSKIDPADYMKKDGFEKTHFSKLLLESEGIIEAEINALPEKPERYSNIKNLCIEIVRKINILDWIGEKTKALELKKMLAARLGGITKKGFTKEFNTFFDELYAQVETEQKPVRHEKQKRELRNRYPDKHELAIKLKEMQMDEDYPSTKKDLARYTVNYLVDDGAQIFIERIDNSTDNALLVYKGESYDVFSTRGKRFKVLIDELTDIQIDNDHGFRSALETAILSHPKKIMMGETTWYYWRDDKTALYLYSGGNKMLRITETDIDQVPIGTDGVVVYPSPWFREWRFIPDVDVRASEKKLLNHLKTGASCHDMNATFIFYWFHVLPFQKFMSTCPVMWSIGASNVGKSVLSSTISILVYGEDRAASGTQAALEREASHNPVLFFPNHEKWHEEFTVFIAKLATKEGIYKCLAGSQEKTMFYKPHSFAVGNSIENPLNREEVLNRMIGIDHDNEFKADEFVKSDFLDSIIADRDEILSGWVKRIQKTIKMFRDSSCLVNEKKAVAALLGNKPKDEERLTDFFAVAHMISLVCEVEDNFNQMVRFVQGARSAYKDDHNKHLEVWTNIAVEADRILSADDIRIQESSKLNFTARSHLNDFRHIKTYIDEDGELSFQVSPEIDDTSPTTTLKDSKACITTHDIVEYS